MVTIVSCEEDPQSSLHLTTNGENVKRIGIHNGECSPTPERDLADSFNIQDDGGPKDEEMTLQVAKDDLIIDKSKSKAIRGSRKRKFTQNETEDEPVSPRTLRPRTSLGRKDDSSSSSISPVPTKKKRGRVMGTKKKNVGLDRCKLCRQFFNSPELMYMEGHPHNSVEETVALVHPKFTDSYSERELPLNKLTHYSIYDANGHLCSLDGGVLERRFTLHASGYMKAVDDDDSSPEGGIPVREIGPIDQWWIDGYDGGEKALIGISTESAEYYLLEPSPLYAPLMESAWEKIYLGKLVIEFLKKEENPTFEDLLNHIQISIPPPRIPKITEDTLIRHAQFVCDQVSSYDDAGYDSEDSDEDEDFDKLIDTPCMQTLIDLAGATFSARKGAIKEHRSSFSPRKKIKDKKPDPKAWSKATTTPLVNEIFETFFADQLDSKNEKSKAKKRIRCGVCEACQRKDCGTCKACSNMVKFGGTGLYKQGCFLRTCPNVGTIESNESDSEVEVVSVKNRAQPNKLKNSSLFCSKKIVEWISEAIPEKGGNKSYYRSAKVGDEIVTIGDYVSCQPIKITSPVVIGRVESLWESTSTKKKYVHLYLFSRGCETVLGETADPQELFVLDQCEHTALNGIISKVNVHYKTPSSDWKMDGGLDKKENGETDESTFFYSKKYDEDLGRFVDITPAKDESETAPHKNCIGCLENVKKVLYNSPQLENPLEEESKNDLIHFEVFKWKNEEYKIGQCIYLKPETFKFGAAKFNFSSKFDNSNEQVDEDIYPELYRKIEKRAPEVMPAPFCIGLISKIKSKEGGARPKDDVIVTVYKFYRPENTKNVVSNLREQDLTKLFGSDEEVDVQFSSIVGKCYVAFQDNVPDGDVSKWCSEGPNRFYMSESYDSKARKTVDPIRIFRNLGGVGKGGGKGKSGLHYKKLVIPSHPSISRPLKCLDVFAGCGGLSEGLHQSGIAETKWAIEKEEAAANAFKVNNPGATVFTDDCNYFLKAVMNGEQKNNKGQKFPQKGEVELLVGGPPCQGFSGMNRFNSREYSSFKNSLIVSYLSFCDYYRPRFFILENVRNFVCFKRSMVLKLTLRCLLKIGYQVAFGVLQAAHYGVPQTRRRVIIMAAAPGEILPFYPEPLYTFHVSATKTLKVIVDDHTFIATLNGSDSAPFRATNVFDAMSDLPDIENGHDEEEMEYNSDAITHFQKMMRDKIGGNKLRDHICKNMSLLVAARMKHVPKKNGSDWRDLPNIVVKLSDGTYTKKLVYDYDDAKSGKSSTGALRGVCQCAVNGKCDPTDRQFNTLIPWCLPHTGNRHNNWASLYGRLEWDGYFRTTVTNPEPMGKQGRVLHPEQNRVVSVRECARSQGFPDRYKFFGTILDKHRQVGNAVPPPMGKAIGLQIRNAVHQTESVANKNSADA